MCTKQNDFSKSFLTQNQILIFLSKGLSKLMLKLIFFISINMNLQYSVWKAHTFHRTEKFPLLTQYRVSINKKYFLSEVWIIQIMTRWNWPKCRRILLNSCSSINKSLNQSPLMLAGAFALDFIVFWIRSSCRSQLHKVLKCVPKLKLKSFGLPMCLRGTCAKGPC